MRDYASDRCFQGRLVLSSDRNDADSLLWEDVSIFTEDRQYLYNVYIMYYLGY